METLYALHSSYQVRENYNTDSENGLPAYWKNKGEATRVSALFNLEQLQAFSFSEKQAIVDADEPESCEWFDYSGQDWEIVTLDADLLERVRAHCAKSEDDLGYTRYNFKGTEFEFDWACKQDKTIVDGLPDYDNSRYYIFGDEAA